MDHRALDQEYVERLRELHDAETAVVNDLPARLSQMYSSELRRALEYCLERSREHLDHTEMLLSRAQQCSRPAQGSEIHARRNREPQPLRIAFRYSRTGAGSVIRDTVP